VKMYEERTVAGLGISQHFSMPRKMLGVCRGLLGILALMRAPLVNGGRADIFAKCNCKLDLETKCPLWGNGACWTSKYCDNWGYDFESKSDKNPDCKECEAGYYFNVSAEHAHLVQPHKEVAGPDEKKDIYTVVEDCASDLGGAIACVPKTLKTTIMVPGDPGPSGPTLIQQGRKRDVVACSPPHCCFDPYCHAG